MGSPTLDILTQNDVVIQGLLFGTVFETVNTLSSCRTKPAMMACRSISIAGMQRLITNLWREEVGINFVQFIKLLALPKVNELQICCPGEAIHDTSE